MVLFHFQYCHFWDPWIIKVTLTSALKIGQNFLPSNLIAFIYLVLAVWPAVVIVVVLVVVLVVLMAVLFVSVVSAIQAGSSKHSNVCSVKVPPKADMCNHMQTPFFISFPILSVCLKRFIFFDAFCDRCRFVLKYCLFLPTLAGTCSRQLVKTVAWGLRGLRQARGGFSQDVEFEGIRGGQLRMKRRLLYKTWSVFKSARQIGLKGLLAGAEKGGWGLGVARSLGWWFLLIRQLGHLPAGHLEAAPVTGQVRPGHCQDGTRRSQRAASTIPATRFVVHHPIPAVSLAAPCASAVCGSSGSLSWERSLRRSCGSSPVSSPGGTKVLGGTQWKPAGSQLSNWQQSGSEKHAGRNMLGLLKPALQGETICPRKQLTRWQTVTRRCQSTQTGVGRSAAVVLCRVRAKSDWDVAKIHLTSSVLKMLKFNWASH